MRMFIAINFNEQIKNKIIGIIDDVKKYAIQGRFVKKEHIHLTLEFLGEVSHDKVESIISAMELINPPGFNLSLSGLGYFRRKDGDIYWLGIKENKNLMVMQSMLHNILLKKGFLLQKREFRPHITIGRQVKLASSINSDVLGEEINKINIFVN